MPARNPAPAPFDAGALDQFRVAVNELFNLDPPLTLGPWDSEDAALWRDYGEKLDGLRAKVWEHGRQTAQALESRRQNSTALLQFLVRVENTAFPRTLQRDWLSLTAELERHRIVNSGAGSKPKKKRGRPLDTDPNKDQRILNAWNTGRFRTYKALGKELQLTGEQVKLAIDRQRKRLKEGSHE
jgi:hypothetical protein